MLKETIVAITETTITQCPPLTLKILAAMSLQRGKRRVSQSIGIIGIIISLLGGSLRRRSQGATRCTIIKLGVSVAAGKVGSIPRSFSPSFLSAPLFLGNDRHRPVLASDFPFRKLAPDTYLTVPPLPIIQVQVPAANEELARTVPLALDTACTTLALNPKIIQECNVRSHQRTVRYKTTGGLSAAHRVIATEIQFFLGGKVVGPLRALGKHSAVSSWKDGEIGQNLLKEFAAVELDYRLGTVSIYSDMHELPTRSEDSILLKQIWTRRTTPAEVALPVSTR